jgi:molybdenum cofactor cytidylyltransferase
VTGAVDLADALPAGARTIENPNWACGQATSLQTAVRWAEDAGFDALVVGLGDQPLVPPEAWRAVASASSPIAIAEFDGRRCPPTRLAAAVWPLLPLDGDEGARVVMAANPELVEAVACPGQPIDIDTVEDLARWS